MSVGSPTAGTWSSSQWRLDNEFETDRREHRPNSRSVQVHSVATRGSPHIAVPGYVAYCVQKLLSRKSGHGTRLLVEVDLLTKE